MTVVPQCPPVPAPSMASGLLDSWFDAGAAAVEGLGKFWTAAFERGPAAFDVPRWVALTAERRAPSWATPHGIVFEHELARLRDFSVSKRRVVPTLVLPPQAGHDSCIVDYSPEQSQMRTIVAAGLERALSLDWVGATAETADATIEDYLDVVDRAVEHCGGRVNLIGDCQGGWLATLYAALHPERMNTLTIAGAPIDFHAGEPVIHEVIRHARARWRPRFYEALVASGGGVLKGRHMLTGFIMIQPGAETHRQFDLLRQPRRPRPRRALPRVRGLVQAHAGRARSVLPVDRPQPVQRQRSDLGTLEVGGEKVDLGRLDMPLNLLGGAHRPHHPARSGVRPGRPRLDARGLGHPAHDPAVDTSGCS